MRSVYRDVATLQARRTPIETQPASGKCCGAYELPPLTFTEDEDEAIVVGVRLLARTGDPGLQKAAESVLSKVTLVVPDRCATTRFLHSATCRRQNATRSAPRKMWIT